ncbi:glutathione S-transferase PARB [Amborella trichopoda]|uniref:glutathione S-transferase PARB n=1 Tax=Amborella trichopoda TaxID=13333 RepID=UPI0005D4503A|nr:glutathione S-transferase PARB [Amborella trichopoda]|eukprot:XP_006855530.2 glutathione S-transferase PARB [Amborella trichopoda]
MAIKLHGSWMSTATLRVGTTLTEKGLDFEFVPVDIRAKEHKQENFLPVNVFQIELILDLDRTLHDPSPPIASTSAALLIFVYQKCNIVLEATNSFLSN